jgi:octaprenyl-diphosphate synthase
MKAVDAVVRARLHSDVVLVRQVAEYIIAGGGKRMRPALVVLSANALGYAGKNHHELAAVVEFIHTATLLHDDVVDESGLRRGKQTARMLWGNQASVLVGDFLLGQAFKMMVEVGSLTALDILSDAAAVIAEGEVMQLAAAKKVATSEATYNEVIRAKTAALFKAAAEVGPVVAGRDGAERAAFAAYGLALGYAFQLVDDALDYGGTSASLGKRVGDDFREGKVTLPVILAFAAGNPSERAFWRRAIEGGETGDAELAQAVALLNRHGAIAATLERARRHGETAKAALAELAPSPFTTALAEVVDFTIARTH